MKKLLSLITLSVFTTMAFAQMRISQVYGGGGTATATFKHDFVELFNAGASPASLNGLSVQYAASGGNFTFICILPNVSVPAGGYYLIQMTTGAGTGIGTFTPDFASPTNIAMAAGQGKIVLVNGTTTAGICPSAGSFIDKVGYGTSTNVCAEGTATATLNATSSATRTNSCVDTDNNSLDFTVGTPIPRNSSTTPAPCSAAVPALNIASNFSGMVALTGTVSNEKTFTISASDLTTAAGNLTVASTGNVEIATATGGSFSNSLSIPYSGSLLAVTTLYARIKATAPLGAVSETITVSGGGATVSPSITASGSVVTNEPTVQASDIIFSNVTDHSFQFSWTNGDGTSRIAVIKQASNPTDGPLVDGMIYNANAAYGQGSILTPNNAIVYSGSGSGLVTVTGLAAGTNYTVRIYEYNGNDASANFLTSITGTNNPLSQATTGTTPVNTIQQQDFTGVSVPLYMSALATTNRVPMMFYAKIKNLAPSTAYRYFTSGASLADLGTANSAGLPILVDYNNGKAFSIPTGASIAATSASGNFGTFTTDATGSFSGSFGIITSTNARFTAGNIVYPVISLGIDNGTITTIQQRLALDQTVTTLAFGTTATDGTFIKGTSSATAKNLVALWQSPDGSSFVSLLARPLAMTYAEIAGATTTTIPGYDNTTNGAWNTIIPNNNPNGIQLIQQIDLVTGAVVGCTSDADGVWGAANTINPNGGATAISITSADAPLTAGSCFSILAVNLNNFTAIKKGNAAKLNWSTAQEVNSSSFDVLRSTDAVNWKTVATVAAAGNSNTARNYEAYDNAPASGRNLYRLRSIDADGKSTLSDIRTLIFSDRFEITVSPNPVKDVININISKKGNTPIQIALINNTGAVVGKYITNSTSYSINAAGLNKGLYILKVISDDVSTTEKVIIQ